MPLRDAQVVDEVFELLLQISKVEDKETCFLHDRTAPHLLGRARSNSMALYTILRVVHSVACVGFF